MTFGYLLALLAVCVEQLILGHAYDEYFILAQKPGMTPMQWHQRPGEVGEPARHRVNEPPMRQWCNRALPTKKNIPVQGWVATAGWTSHRHPPGGVSPGVPWQESPSANQRDHPARGGSWGGGGGD
jgi:hypothetical protein